MRRRSIEGTFNRRNTVQVFISSHKIAAYTAVTKIQCRKGLKTNLFTFPENFNILRASKTRRRGRPEETFQPFTRVHVECNRAKDSSRIDPRKQNINLNKGHGICCSIVYIG